MIFLNGTKKKHFSNYQQQQNCWHFPKWFEKSFTRDLHTHTHPLITCRDLPRCWFVSSPPPDPKFSFLFSSNPSDLLLFYNIIICYCCYCSVYLDDLLFLRPPPPPQPTKPRYEFSVNLYNNLISFFIIIRLGSLVINYDVQGSPFRRCPFKKKKLKRNFSIWLLPTPPPTHHIILKIIYLRKNKRRNKIAQQIYSDRTNHILPQKKNF